MFCFCVNFLISLEPNSIRDLLLENNPKIILVTALQILPEVLKAYIYATHGTDSLC
nr:MAG TPA: hypothetical protein [Caudoviricetes sp.]